MPAPQLFSLTLALLFAIINGHRVQRHFLCSGIEAVITGLTRKGVTHWPVCPRQIPLRRVLRGLVPRLKIAVLAPKSRIRPRVLQAGDRKNKYGELSEWSMVQHSKWSTRLFVLSTSKSSSHAGLSQFKKVNILLFCPVVLSSVFFRISGLTYGELSEWSKVQHSKCCVPKRNLGFESLTLRQKRRHTAVLRHDAFFLKAYRRQHFSCLTTGFPAVPRAAPGPSPSWRRSAVLTGNPDGRRCSP